MNMGLVFVSWHDAVASIDFMVIPLVFATVISIVYTVSHLMKPRQDILPPFAPGGMIQHVKMLTSSQYPWLLLDVAREMNSSGFQLSLPGGFFWKYNFVVGDPKTFRAILTDSLSTKPFEIYGRMRGMNGSDTMFMSNGNIWHSKRKSVSPAFSSNQIKRMNTLAIEKCESWIQRRLKASNGGVVRFDVAVEMVDIVLSAFCETAFDYKMPKWERDYLGEELECALTEFARKGCNIFRSKLAWFIASRRRALQAGKNLRHLCLKIMDEYRRKDNKTQGTIIQLIMNSDHAFPTDDDKAAQLLEFLVAGFDTTGYTISWILLSLAQNEAEQTKLRESLRLLTPDTWRNSQELQWVIKEGMRLYPVASAGSIRTIGRDITTSEGHLLPIGSNCFLPFLLLFRNPDVFPNPDSFIPSRWENPTREQLDAFQPFSLGKQNCVGQSLARAETTSIIARIISEFEISVDDSAGPITCDFFLTLKPVGAFLTARKV